MIQQTIREKWRILLESINGEWHKNVREGAWKTSWKKKYLCYILSHRFILTRWKNREVSVTSSFVTRQKAERKILWVWLELPLKVLLGRPQRLDGATFCRALKKHFFLLMRIIFPWFMNLTFSYGLELCTCIILEPINCRQDDLSGLQYFEVCVSLQKIYTHRFCCVGDIKWLLMISLHVKIL